MKKGKVLCEQLKAIRQQVADKCGLTYAPVKCDFEGDCPGSCPQCEREATMLQRELEEQIKDNPGLLDELRSSPEIMDILCRIDVDAVPDGEEFEGYIDVPSDKDTIQWSRRSTGRVVDLPKRPMLPEKDDRELLGIIIPKDDPHWKDFFGDETEEDREF